MAEYGRAQGEPTECGVPSLLATHTVILHKYLKDQGMTQAALGVDTNNPGGAFQLYTGLGFELQAYEAVYTKPIAV